MYGILYNTLYFVLYIRYSISYVSYALHTTYAGPTGGRELRGAAPCGPPVGGELFFEVAMGARPSGDERKQPGRFAGEQLSKAALKNCTGVSPKTREVSPPKETA